MLNAFGKHVLGMNNALSDVSKGVIDRLDVKQTDYSEGDVIYQIGDRARHINVVKRGWLSSTVTLANGGRQLLNIYVPTEVTGLEFLTRERAPSSLKALSPAILISIKREEFIHMMRQSPDLMQHLFSVIGLQDVMMQERVCAMSRMDAKHKIAYFLLALKSKSSEDNEESPTSLFLPLTQYDIADALGLTNVTVSKTMSELEREGYIQYKRQKIEFLRPEALKKMVNFVNQYALYQQENLNSKGMATAA